MSRRASTRSSTLSGAIADSIVLEGALVDAVVLVPHLLRDLHDEVTVDDFCSPWHASVYGVATGIGHHDGQPPYLRVHAELMRRGVHVRDHDICRLYELRCPDTAQALDLARWVHRAAGLRRGLAALEEVAERIRSGDPVAPALVHHRMIREVA